MKKITVNSFKGQAPGDNEASYWNKEDWDKHNAEVAELKASGEYGKPITINFIMNTIDGFDDNRVNIEFGILVPLGSLKDGDLPKITYRDNPNDWPL